MNSPVFPVSVERPVWVRGVDCACSTSPCCGREIRVNNAWVSEVRKRDWAMDQGQFDSDPDPKNRWDTGFWRSKRCLSCGSRWFVLFEWPAVLSRQPWLDGPEKAHWRPADEFAYAWLSGGLEAVDEGSTAKASFELSEKAVQESEQAAHKPV
jgi:hypothetical protein